jgi:uncharacterized protein YdhG (YjbR/CyaY superfamily)
MAAAGTVEEYIGGFPPEVRVLLLRLRETIRQAVPQGVETISAGAPMIMVPGGRAIHWSASKKYFTLQAPQLPAGVERELSEFRDGDGLQFPYRKEVPFEALADAIKALGSGS